MREASLPSPGVGSKSQHLRRIAANAISAIEITAPRYADGAHPAATGLAAFFTACAAAATEAGKSNLVLVFAGAGGVTTIAGTTTNQTTLNKGGSAGAASYSSSAPGVATVNGTGLVTGVAPGATIITVTVAAQGIYRAATATLLFTVTA